MPTCYSVVATGLLIAPPPLAILISPHLSLSSSNNSFSWCLSHSWITGLPPADAVHAAVQPAGKAAAAEVVCSSVRQGEKEDLQGSGPDYTGQEAQNVQLLGVARPEDCVQKVGV